MKRMVKNGDLIDVEPDGSITVAGKPVGGGGSDYTAGKNITISEAKEISIPDDIGLLKSISIYNRKESGKITLKQSYDHSLTIESENQSYVPSLIVHAGTGVSAKELKIRFNNIPIEKTYQLLFDFNGINESNVYPFISRSRIPDVPSGDGTYSLKATVSAGAVTYSWVAQ